MFFLKQRPLFLFLLPLFFVLHGFTRHFHFVPVSDGLLLVAVYAGSALLIAAIFYLFYRNFIKASLIAFLLTGFNFFFGSIHDALKAIAGSTFFSRYSFILPFSLIVLIIIIIAIKRRKKPLSRITSYLNILLLLLIVIDIGWLASKAIRRSEKSIATGTSFVKCDTCKKPDIYLIILDEYPGNKALKEQFGFDNTGFENELTERGFQVISNTTSNYNYTPYSVASILSMDYLHLDMKTKNPGNLNYCYEIIKDNSVLRSLEAYNYKFYNYSIFDFKDQPARLHDNFLPARSKLITSQTFLNRLWEDFRDDFFRGKLNFMGIGNKFVYSHLNNNKSFINNTLHIAGSKTSSPKLVYTHLMMPHYPYYFNSNGRALPFDSLVKNRALGKHHFTEYLRYCNKQILQLADDILKKSAEPPVIIFSGDHGYRSIEPAETRQYCFMNLLAVYLPDKNYTGFYPGMSGVNTFRVFLNTQFKQGLPLLKDSTTYLWD